MSLVVYGKRNYGSSLTRAGAASIIQRAWRARKARQNSKAVVVSRWPRAPLATRGFYGPQRRSPEEQKVIDTAQASYSMDSSGTVVLLNGVATGTDFTNRIGRRVTISSIQIRGIIRPTDLGTNPQCVRLMLVYDTQPNGALPAVGEVVQNLNGTTMLNLNNRDRFKVIMDKQYAIGGISDTATQAYAMSPTVFNVKMYKKCNYDVIFDGTTNAISDIQSGSIFLLTLGSEAAATGATLQASIRLRFKDA